MTTYTGSELLRLTFSGGVANRSPAACLGGYQSAYRVLGMYPQAITTVPGLVVEDATPECGLGVATLVCAAGAVTLTPATGGAGVPVAVAEGARAFVAGDTATQGVWVYREAGLPFVGTATFRLVDALNGVFSMGDIGDADRVAGVVTYRAIFVQRMGLAQAALFWMTTDGQSTYALADGNATYEGGSGLWTMGSIANEETAPGGVSWVDAVSQATALHITGLAPDDRAAIWIRRTFAAAGDVAANEQANFHMMTEEGG